MLGRAMTTWYVEFSATPPGVDRDAFEEHVEAVLVELSALDGISDADAMVDYSQPKVTFSMVVTSDAPSQAVERAVMSMRTAIHAAGGGTPGWEKLITRMIDEAHYGVQREDVSA